MPPASTLAEQVSVSSAASAVIVLLLLWDILFSSHNFVVYVVTG
jgi:hypothetical protein